MMENSHEQKEIAKDRFATMYSENQIEIKNAFVNFSYKNYT